MRPLANRVGLGSVHSCLVFVAVFQQGFGEGDFGICKLQARLSVFMRRAAS